MEGSGQKTSAAKDASEHSPFAFSERQEHTHPSDAERLLVLRLKAHTPHLADEGAEAYQREVERSLRLQRTLAGLAACVFAVPFLLIFAGMMPNSFFGLMICIVSGLVAFAVWLGMGLVNPDTCHKPVSAWAMGQLEHAAARVPLVEATLREWRANGFAITDSEYWLLTHAVQFAEKHGLCRPVEQANASSVAYSPGPAVEPFGASGP